MHLTRDQRPHSYHEPNYHCPEPNLSPHHSPMYHAHKCGTSRQPYAQRDPTPSIDIELRRSIATKSCQTMVEQSCRQQQVRPPACGSLVRDATTKPCSINCIRVEGGKQVLGTVDTLQAAHWSQPCFHIAVVPF